MRTNKDTPVTYPVKRIVQESPTMRTFFFNNPGFEPVPGQFLMVWLPGVDEKPLGFSFVGKEIGLTVKRVGPFTEELFSLKKGSLIGLRGPYGKGFELKNRAVVVGGGVGIAPLAPLIEALRRPKLFLGCRSKRDLLFAKRFALLNPRIATNDGSKGTACKVTELLEKELLECKPPVVYACGPELMLKEVFRICEKHKVDCQLLLERYMKCGIGVCGQCTVGHLMVCKDGPVFHSSQLRKLKEFGEFTRLKSGKKIPIGGI